MGRKKRQRQSRHLGAILLVAGAVALAIGLYIQHELDRYQPLSVFATQERGWRTLAFQTAMWTGGIGCCLLVLLRVLR